MQALVRFSRITTTDTPQARYTPGQGFPESTDKSPIPVRGSGSNQLRLGHAVREFLLGLTFLSAQVESLLIFVAKRRPCRYHEPSPQPHCNETKNNQHRDHQGLWKQHKCQNENLINGTAQDLSDHFSSTNAPFRDNNPLYCCPDGIYGSRAVFLSLGWIQTSEGVNGVSLVSEKLLNFADDLDEPIDFVGGVVEVEARARG